MKKKLFAVAYRDRKGNWHDMESIHASSSVMARNIAFNRVSGLGIPGECEMHRVKPGKTIYEYDNGALYVEKVQS